jgi:hypothetical protein
MKKIMLAAAALFVLAGSTFAATTATPNQTAKVSKKTLVSRVVPGCPPNDPNGCGIFD